MHRNSAATWAAKNVRINCVTAGLMDAPASAEVSQDPKTAPAAAEVGFHKLHSRQQCQRAPQGM
jgi:NAD(P)-dependent dehydrogenase (short-subunit alcohol dehydrogenase family)